MKIIGPVLTSKGGVLASMPTDFTIDTSHAGVGTPEVHVLVRFTSLPTILVVLQIIVANAR